MCGIELGWRGGFGLNACGLGGLCWILMLVVGKIGLMSLARHCRCEPDGKAVHGIGMSGTSFSGSVLRVLQRRVYVLRADLAQVG